MSVRNAKLFIENVVSNPTLAKAVNLPGKNFKEVLQCAAQEGFECTDKELLSVLRLYMVDELSLPQWLAKRVVDLAIWHRWEQEPHIESQDVKKKTKRHPRVQK